MWPESWTAENVYYSATAVSLFFAGVWALVQWGASIRQRSRELKWRQAEAAWQLLDKVFEDQVALLAFELIDGERDTVDVPGKGPVAVSRDVMLSALRPTDETPTGAEPMIRYAFNSALYAMDRLESAIISGYVREEDIVSPTAYYARLFHGVWPELVPYAESAGYYRALALIHRLRNGPARPQRVPWAGE